MQIKQREFMNGTDGNPNYLIIGKKGHYTIGLKPVLAPHPQVLAGGMHLRVIWSDPDATLENKFLRQQKFPNLKFTKAVPTHASVILPFAFKLPAHESNQQAFFDAMSGMINDKQGMLAIVDACYQKLGLTDGSAEFSAKSVADFVSERFSRFLLQAKLKALALDKGKIAMKTSQLLAAIKLSPDENA